MAVDADQLAVCHVLQIPHGPHHRQSCQIIIAAGGGRQRPGQEKRGSAAAELCCPISAYQMGIDVGYWTGLTGGRLVMIGHYCRNAVVAYLLNHSAAKIREYDQIGIMICNLA